MFQPLLNLRLLIVDSCNELAAAEQESTARAWVDILDLESSQLIEGAREWVPFTKGCDAGEPFEVERRAHTLGLAEGRLSLIVVDQLVAALIRGHLTGVEF